MEGYIIVTTVAGKVALFGKKVADFGKRFGITGH